MKLIRDFVCLFTGNRTNEAYRNVSRLPWTAEVFAMVTTRKNITILFCGKFDPGYNRTRIIIHGMRELGVNVILYPYRKKRTADREELRRLIRQSDLVFLPSFTHTDVPFIRKLTSGPILFDPLISRYLSKVFDYQAISRYSPRAYKNYLKDSRGLKHADLVLSDTRAHKEYFTRKFNVDPAKIQVVPVGVITEDFFPQYDALPEKTGLTVGFYGSFIPLHGIGIILQAARILADDPDFHFRLVGDGILMKEMKEQALSLGLDQVEFTGLKEYRDLNREINCFDIALGIFGESLKARSVIPNKIFHYAACARPIITMDSPAIREIFTPDEHIILSSNNPQKLAESLVRLKDPGLRERLGQAAYRLVSEQYDSRTISRKILELVKAGHLLPG